MGLSGLEVFGQKKVLGAVSLAAPQHTKFANPTWLVVKRNLKPGFTFSFSLRVGGHWQITAQAKRAIPAVSSPGRRGGGKQKLHFVGL